MSERYKCDRNGGCKADYLRRRVWTCPHCGAEKFSNGHVCSDCRRRVCCECFHHDMGCCITAPGSDVRPIDVVVAKLEAPCPGVRPKPARTRDRYL